MTSNCCRRNRYFFVANVAEGMGVDDPLVVPVIEAAQQRKTKAIVLAGQLEAELSTLPEQERAEFFSRIGSPRVRSATTDGQCS